MCSQAGFEHATLVVGETTVWPGILFVAERFQANKMVSPTKAEAGSNPNEEAVFFIKSLDFSGP